MWVSRVVYRARLGDTGAVVRCSSVQSSPGGSILYTVGTNSSVGATNLCEVRIFIH